MTPDINSMLPLVGGGVGHSPLFSFLRLHHDSIVAKAAGERMNWEKLCHWFAQAGLTNVHGEAPSKDCARQTWYRVRKTISAVAKKLAAADASKRAALEAQRAEALANKRTLENDRETLRSAMLRADEGVQERRLAASRERSKSVLFPDMRASQTTPKGELIDTPPMVTPPPVTIGQVAAHVTMKKQAPRYGDARNIPLPAPYVGPRPEGMPANLPLEALMPLSATGRRPDGNIDFEQMPGLPRRSFYETDREWALDCMPMLEAIPHGTRTNVIKAMISWMEMKLGNGYRSK
ncbi:hypothetical protein [Acetobacter sp. LMG 32666]|uniref:hypothetical protein n=1 Tax=Acetobacter sp. LMG 32666 TaxID=2959295 RepID=UPI0030C89972